MKKILSELLEKEKTNETLNTKTKTQIQSLKKDNEEMNRKLTDISNTEIGKVDKLEFRHDKYKEIEDKINPLVEKSDFN